MRIVHNKHRTAAQVYSELHWLEFLRHHGATVAGPFPSLNDNLVETIVVEDTPLHVSVFARARGKLIDIRQERNNKQLFQAWGLAIGRLHRLTADYRPPADIVRREDDVNIFKSTLAQYIPAEPALQERVAAIVGATERLPKTKDWYGLIHSDVHQYNFFYDGEAVQIFDFDDACYHQLASDLAIPLYYAIWGNNLKSQAEKDAFGRLFFEHFLIGYQREFHVSREHLATIPLLLQFRDCELLAVLLSEFGATPSEKEIALVESFKKRLLENQLIVNI